jgi:rare lipoprotein A
LLKVLRDKLAKLPRPSAVVQKPAPVSGTPVRVEPSAVGQSDGRFIREGGNSPNRPIAAVETPSRASGSYTAQIAAFSSRSRADALARKIGGSVAASEDGRVFRVRVGPFKTEGEAAAAARQKGYPQARVYKD